MAYRLQLPTTITGIHNVFHVSQLKKYYPDTSHVIQPEEVTIEEDLSYVEQPVRILDQKV